MSVTVDTLYRVADGDNSILQSIPDILDMYDENETHSSKVLTQYRTVTPVGFGQSIIPTTISANRIITPSGSSGDVYTTDIQTPMFGYTGYGSTLSNSFTMYFWDSVSGTYKPVILSMRYRDDVISYRRGTSTVYPPETYNGMFLNPATITDGSNIRLLMFRDLHFSGGRRTWAFPEGDTIQVPLSGSAYYEGPRSASLFANFYGYSGTVAPQDFTTYTFSPLISTIFRNEEDPDKNWCGKLYFYMSHIPAGDYYGYNLTNLDEYRQIRRNYTYSIGDNVPQMHVPEEYGPFENWTVLLTEDFGFADFDYSVKNHSVLSRSNVIFT